ncbi:hypothetical protein D3C80_462930 [compost metagenome]
MDCIACTIAHDLHFDVTRLFEIFLDIDCIITKRSTCFGTCRCKGYRQIIFGLCDFHTATTTTGGCLDDDRIADFLCDALGFVFVGHTTIRTRNDRNAKALCSALGFNFVTHDADMRRGWSNEGNAMCFENFSKLGIFRKEAVARMDCIRASDFASGNDLMNIQIAVA